MMPMARDAIPLNIPDLAAFARALRISLAKETGLPSHQAMLGHLATAAGYRNWQHLVALASPAPAAPALDPAALRRAERARHVFDASGRMQHWPAQTALQALCLWVLWARLPADRSLSDPEINAALKDWCPFGDHVLVRRSLIDHRLVARSADNRIYRRIEQSPPPEALLVIRQIGPALPI
jgi:hypothetical protein